MIGKNGKWTLELWHDTSFRPVFGAIGSEPILICLLNAVFIEAELPLVKEIVYVNPHQFGDSNNSRETILDILVVDETGRQINVEMQSQSQEGYLERTICYLTRLYSSQYKTGVLYKNLKPALSISFVRFPIWDEKPDVWFERVTFAGIETARSVDALKIINVRVPERASASKGSKPRFYEIGPTQ
ncbi:MAG: Rpn family recombination-promoting nuclease/putative transposase [Thermoguttaceae bacterium]|nr:Rpn family recombination-promoting nuclease/putative transposase [Thermoguttaceae bacterium]